MINLIFDIGANKGKSSDIFINKCEKIICFEPNPSLVKSLKKKYNNSKIEVDSRAISDKSGIQEFNISNADTISTLSSDWIYNSRFSKKYQWDNKIMVETITLSDAIKDYGVPDYIKIDTEGYEYEILTNFNELLPKTLFAFEWAEEQKNKIKKTLSHLKNIGYNNFAFTNGDPILFDEDIDWVSYENFNLVQTMDENRKTEWGMIYFKK